MDNVEGHDPEVALSTDGKSSSQPESDAVAEVNVTSSDEKDEKASASQDGEGEDMAITVRSSAVQHQQHAPSSMAADTESQSSSNHVVVARKKPAVPRLIHPILLRIPMQIRYTIYGALSSAFFMVLYNVTVERLGTHFFPSTIYAGVYLLFIPIQHAMASCLVFGWPDRYIASLSSNVPIGLTAIALGSYLTAYLDQIDFDRSIDNLVRSLSRVAVADAKKDADTGEFYSSLLVLIVTSVWSFLLSVLVNSPTETTEKKEL